jgi:hypothetical protein
MIFIASLSISSCKESQKADYSRPTKVETKTTALSANDHPGKKLLETKCYVCHSPSAHHEGRIAPPMVAIKSHYLDDDMTKEQFVNAMWNFVEEPSKEKSKMRGAVKRFGVMPYQLFLKEEVNLISEYMYDYKIDEPEWFKERIEDESKGNIHNRNAGKKKKITAAASTKTPGDIGLEDALNTKKGIG